MAKPNGDSSLDPIAQASSAPASRTSRTRPPGQKSSTRFTSPTKSVVFDTPGGHGLSPLRIRVTVEPHPKEITSPSRRNKDLVPAVDEGYAGLFSPVKRMNTDSSEEEINRRTPRRRRNPPAERFESDQNGMSRHPDKTHAGSKPSRSPLRQAPRRRSRKEGHASSSYRTTRLGIAREELNEALQDAVGSPQSRAGSEVAGDLTVSANEDFSMVSMESLISVKATDTLNPLPAILEQNDHLVVETNSPSPLKVQYPEISGPAREARASLGRSSYDAMSWKPTETTSEARERIAPKQIHILADINRDVESDGISEQDHTPPRTMETRQGATKTPSSDEIGLDDDIWQEEASRSVDGDSMARDQQETLPERQMPQNFNDLFGDQQLKPPRPKIPRTWRRTSGHDFSYMNSPEPEAQPRKRSGASTDGSGVLTPPTSDEEPMKTAPNRGLNQQQTEHSDFTQPDAAGTLFNEQTNLNDRYSTLATTPHHDAVSPFSDSGSSVTSPDAEDTGLFWQTNLPNVYRSARIRPKPQRQTAMDLTDLLRSDKVISSPAGLDAAEETAKSNRSTKPSGAPAMQPNKREPLRMRPVLGDFRLSESNSQQEKLISSPLRQSLLRSSKVSPNLASTGKETGVGADHTRERGNGYAENDVLPLRDAQIQREFQHGTKEPARKLQHRNLNRSDRLDGVMNGTEDKHRARTKADNHTAGRPNNHSVAAVQKPNDISRSYEEHLNLDSPMKIRVNFNDSSGNSSLLAPTRIYPPLFGNPSKPDNPNVQTEPVKSSNYVTLVAPKPPPVQGIISRLSETFWSAVVRPTGPTEILPNPAPTPTNPHDSSSSSTNIPFPPALRTQLRSRYGVISEQFPWTMTHIRTLHRMLNSRQSPRPDTLIPLSGPLPPNLVSKLNTTQTSVTGHRFLFTNSHAQVVFAFSQVLVPPHVVSAMRAGEVEWLGDSLAKRCRDFYGDRHGDEAVWKVETHGSEISKWVDGLRGEISTEFIVRALGDVVFSNDLLSARRGEEK